MTRRLDDARIRVEIDTSGVERELETLDGQLDRTRPRGGILREPARGRQRRQRGAGAGAGAAGAAIGALGLRRAAGLAARVTGAVTAGAILAELPAILPTLVGLLEQDERFKELLSRVLLDVPDALEAFVDLPPSLAKFEGKTIAELLVELSRDAQTLISSTESAVQQLLVIARTIADFTAEGKSAEMAAAIYRQISEFGEQRLSKLGVETGEIGAILSTHWAYNQARNRFRQLTREAEWAANAARQLEGFRSGMNR